MQVCVTWLVSFVVCVTLQMGPDPGQFFKNSMGHMQLILSFQVNKKIVIKVSLISDIVRLLLRQSFANCKD